MFTRPQYPLIFSTFKATMKEIETFFGIVPVIGVVDGLSVPADIRACTEGVYFVASRE